MLFGKAELVQLSRDLARAGNVAFLVHYFERTGTLFAGDREIRTTWPAWAATVHDAVLFAQAHPRANRASIGLCGYSLGAYLAVAEGARHPQIDAIAEISGGIFNGFSAQMRRLPPMLILHGTADQRVPVRHAYALRGKAAELGQPAEIHLYKGEGHQLSGAAIQDAIRRSVAFFRKHLRS